MYRWRVPLRLLPLAILAILIGCGGADQGYRDPGTLAARLKTTAQTRMDKAPDTYKGAQVTDTKCVEGTGDRTFKCSGEISSGERWTITVTVSEDGKTYVSDN
jgi:hypothetical protein